MIATLLFASIVGPLHGNDIEQGLQSLRSLPEARRAEETNRLALAIRKLPAGSEKLQDASMLSNLATEGDCGHATLQNVADTLAQALKETPSLQPYPYDTLAQIARYEDIKVTLDAPAYRKAMTSLKELEGRRSQVDFALKDLHGKSFTLSKLKGKVVLVNFWATWCPPCRKEMPDLKQLYKVLAPKGLVVLAISDEKSDIVTHFLADKQYGFPILLDGDGAVHKKYEIGGIPNSFIYDRKGRLVSVGIDGRTRGQFLRLLGKAGLSE